MKTINHSRRASLFIFASAAFAVLGGCQVVPKVSSNIPPSPGGITGGSSLPQDGSHHRVAILVPITGKDSALGKAVANAATMALIDTNASNLRLTTYDTATGAREAAQRALRDGNQLILGPLAAENIPAVLSEARPAGVVLISYTNDPASARPDAFVMGLAPEQSVGRVTAYAKAQGKQNLAGLFPVGDYGNRDQLALRLASEKNGGKLVTTERYSPTRTSLTAAAYRVSQQGGYNAVLVADKPSIAASAATIVTKNQGGPVQIIGTEQWSGDDSARKLTPLKGAWFAALSDARFSRFAQSYNSRFGSQPPRMATLGYDSVLLTLRAAQNWRVGKPFPRDVMVSPDGFVGLDGPFRFRADGVAERALEVREVQPNKVVIVSPAPETFGS